MPYDMENLQKLFNSPREEPPKKPAPGGQQIRQLPIDQLEDFPPQLHMFKPASGQRMKELEESIHINGILNALLVRQISEDRYQIIAGHNRRTAARNIGYKNLPCIIKHISDEDEAIQMMIADNISHRELLPSEKGWAYREELRIRKRQAGRPAKNSGQVVQNFTRDEISDNESGRQVQRYIRLTYLLPELLDRVDQGKIGISNGVDLSFLSRESQQAVYDFCYRNEPMRPLTGSQVKALREVDADPDQIIDAELLAELTARKQKIRFRTLKLEMNCLREYFPVGTPEEVVITTIQTALAIYFEKNAGNS